MSEEGWRYVGRITRRYDAVATLEPIVGSKAGGDWTPVQDATKRFPPAGLVELRAPIVGESREGDLILFQPASQVVKQSRTSVRAVSAHRLAPLFGLEDTPDRLRRLLVEVGLDAGEAGVLAVRIGSDRIAFLQMARGADQRLRAVGKGLGAVPLRPFEAERLMRVPSMAGMHYDVDPAALLLGNLNWARDDQYVSSLARLLADGDGVGQAAETIQRLLRGRVDQLTGSISLLDGADPAVLAEVARSRALADRIHHEAETASGLLDAVISNSVVQASLAERVAVAVAGAMPPLIAAERTRVDAEVRAEWAGKRAVIEAELASLEAEGIEVLEAKLAVEASNVDARIAAIRGAESARAEAETATIRSARDAEVAAIEIDVRRRMKEVEALDGRIQALHGEIASLEARRSSVHAAVVDLERSNAELLRARAQMLPIETPPLHPKPGTRAVAPGDLRAEAERTALFTEAGVNAFLRLAAYLIAGEVPVLHGGDALELAELAGSMLAGGRVVVLEADPTIITIDDLWSRPGGAGPTILAAAARWAMGDAPGHALGIVSHAERSGARFWYPALSRSRNQGRMPEGFMVCVIVHDRGAEEAGPLLDEPFAIEADGCFVQPGSIATYHAVEDLRIRPMSLSGDPRAISQTELFSLLGRCGAGLRPSAIQRLARVHAVVRELFGEDAPAISEAAAVALGSKVEPSDRPNSVTPYVRRAANA